MAWTSGLAAQIRSGGISLTEEQCAIYVASCNARGEVPIKPQYLHCVIAGDEKRPFHPLVKALADAYVAVENSLVREEKEKICHSSAAQPPAEEKASTVLTAALPDHSLSGCNSNEISQNIYNRSEAVYNKEEALDTEFKPSHEGPPNAQRQQVDESKVKEPPHEDEETRHESKKASQCVEEVSEGPLRKKARRAQARGMNRKRSANFKAETAAIEQQLCRIVAASIASSCDVGDTCRYSHDREAFKQVRGYCESAGISTASILLGSRVPKDEEDRFLLHVDRRLGHWLIFLRDNIPSGSSYLQSRREYIGNQCPEFERAGVCRFGANCRFGVAHVNSDGFNLDSCGNLVSVEQWQAHMQQATKRDVLNHLSDALRSSLRRKTYTFRRGSQKSDKSNVAEGQAKPQASASPQETLSSAITIASTLSLEERQTSGAAVTLDEKDNMALKLHMRTELFCSGKRMLAPLTTLGNLPFRRLCVKMGAEVTMTEMILAKSIVDGHPSELPLLKRHASERFFGVQIAGGRPGILADCCSFLQQEVQCDFVDFNCACPLDGLHKKMAGSILLDRGSLMVHCATAIREAVPALPVSVKMRMGHGDRIVAHSFLPRLESFGIDAFILHGRTARQRYTRRADWDYVKQCKGICQRAALIGSGDVFSWSDFTQRKEESGVDNVLIGRGALIKPWIFTELAEQSLWDISASERLALMKDFVNFGLEHWGSDSKGVETTRRAHQSGVLRWGIPEWYFLELCSFTHRYVPVGLLEQTPQLINSRPPPFVGRSDLETKLSSARVQDWIELSEMLLGRVPEAFQFVPKHKSNAYETE